ncbi:MAG: glycosyltransferase [Candidatus Microthrix sp.]|nr:glycosyltransferase [Candidatus Microthrix sp.]
MELALAGITYEIIVVDDDSPDETWQLAEAYAEDHQRVRVLRRFHDKGLSPPSSPAWSWRRGGPWA